MNIVFCADYGVLPALHVATFSALQRTASCEEPMNIHVVSDVFQKKDMDLLAKTLDSTGKSYSLSLLRVDPGLFRGFNPLNGSLAAYYKLVIPQLISVERYIYLDVDILCDIDLAPLYKIPMEGVPVAWVSEAPICKAVDRKVAETLGNKEGDLYFNSGVLLVNAPEWKKQEVTSRALEYLTHNEALIREQSALNVVLYGRTAVLDERFNSISNMRKHWPEMKGGYGSIDRLLHFVDYPKPWDLGAEFIHPQYCLWRTVLDKTAMRGFRSWHDTLARKLPRTAKSTTGYKKAIKDRLLFTGYMKGWFKRIKGV